MSLNNFVAQQYELQPYITVRLFLIFKVTQIVTLACY